MSATAGPSRPNENPVQDVANFASGSGWTVQSNVNANDPAQNDPSSTGPQAAFHTRYSGTFSTDPYASAEMPDEVVKGRNAAELNENKRSPDPKSVKHPRKASVANKPVR